MEQLRGRCRFPSSGSLRTDTASRSSRRRVRTAKAGWAFLGAIGSLHQQGRSGFPHRCGESGGEGGIVMTRFLLGGVALVAVVSLLSSAQATTFFVDADNCPGPGNGTNGNPFCSIQAGMDAALNGDEVIVAPGFYSGQVNYNGKAIALRSSDGADVTFITGPGGGVNCNNCFGPGAALEGFTFIGVGSGLGVQNALLCPVVTACKFVNLTTAVNVDHSAFGPSISGCLLQNNTVALLSSFSNPVVSNCT